MFALEAEAVIRSQALFARERTVRRALKRWWDDPPYRQVAWLMLNPSTADENVDDPTTRRLTHFTRSWGYGGWIAVNLYPFVASKPEEMWRRADWEANGPDWYARDDMQANLRDIETVARASDLRIVAFGAEPVQRDQLWLESCLEAFTQPADDEEHGDSSLYCLGVNRHGQPLHPMARGKWRVADDQVPVLWRRA